MSYAAYKATATWSYARRVREVERLRKQLTHVVSTCHDVTGAVAHLGPGGFANEVPEGGWKVWRRYDPFGVGPKDVIADGVSESYAVFLVAGESLYGRAKKR